VKGNATALVIKDWTLSGMETLPCCGIKSPVHPGRRQKNRWLQTQLKKGLRAKFAFDTDDHPCGYIEYVPGEYAWRGVSARGYMFVHCIWTFSKRAQSKGVASALLQACTEDARRTGMYGVAALARNGPWLASSALFLKNGFKVVETTDPDYELLVSKLNATAPNPTFTGNCENRMKKYRTGLTIIRSRQCPHVAKFADEIGEAAFREYGLRPKIIELKSHRDAQNAPTPYAVFAIIYNGQLLADHQISRSRFRNIMRTLRVDKPA
jgi:GNAT superfamily N-acetyltransferase